MGTRKSYLLARLKKKVFQKLLIWNINFYKLLIALVFSVCFLSQGYSQVRKRLDFSTFINPLVQSTDFWVNHARYSGGVSPLGMAEFYSPLGAKTSASDLELYIIDSKKLKDSDIDYDAIGIKLGSTEFELYAQDYMLLPIMKYVKRNGQIAFTLPPVQPIQSYLDQNKLKETSRGFSKSYVAQEFDDSLAISLLRYIDFNSDIESAISGANDFGSEEIKRSLVLTN